MKPQRQGIARERAGGGGEVRGNLTSSAHRSIRWMRGVSSREAGCLLSVVRSGCAPESLLLETLVALGLWLPPAAVNARWSSPSHLTRS